MTLLGTLIWEHPEFDTPRYLGMFPKGYEEKLWRLLGKPDPSSILHVFGGKAKIGLRVDINAEVGPDYIMDAHSLGFPNESFKVVICDPPFSDSDNRNKYGNPDAEPLDMKKWKSEAVRVCMKNGFVVIRHFWKTPTPAQCTEWMDIILQQCNGRHIHMIQIFIKGE